MRAIIFIVIKSTQGFISKTIIQAINVLLTLLQCYNAQPKNQY